ncbi:MAG: T9SS type A sorting domain-containing protein, partial [Candidatus Cloacimonadota bacterium]
STSEPNGLFVYRSTDGGASWNGPFTVINNVPGVFEDKELIACDRSNGPHSGNVYVAWARFFTTQILLSRSTDAGSTFVGPVQVSDYSGVQWPVPCVGPNSEVYVAWVDYTPGSILFDRSTDGGQTFGSDITVQSTSFVYGYIYGDITVFSFPAMDVDITGGPNNGTIYIAYMDDASGYTDTDIYFTKSTDGGNTWTSRVRINDDVQGNGCDQFHPWLMVAPDGSIIVVFLDRRLDPGNLLMDLYMTTSIDGGTSWSANERITTVSSDPTAGQKTMLSGLPREAFPIKTEEPLILAGRAGLLGEYIGVAASSIDNIHPVWTDTRLGNQDVFTGFRIQQSIREIPSPEIQCNTLSLYPNPFHNKVFIHLSISECEQIALSVYNIAGRKIATELLSLNRGGKYFVWDGTDLARGTYFLFIRTPQITRSFTVHKL